MTTAIIFDMDGTLADSSACIVGAAHHVGQVLSLPPVEDAAIRARIGQPLGFMLGQLYQIEGAVVEQAATVYSAEYARIAATEECLFDGVLPLLQELRLAGFRMAIATGKSQRGAEHASARLGLMELMDSVHGIIPGTPGKPDPAVLYRAMQALHVKPEACIMVGDTTFDLDLAHAAGVRTAAVGWGVHTWEQLQSRTPNFMASNIAGLRQWLLRQ